MTWPYQGFVSTSLWLSWPLSCPISIPRWLQALTHPHTTRFICRKRTIFFFWVSLHLMGLGRGDWSTAQLQGSLDRAPGWVSLLSRRDRLSLQETTNKTCLDIYLCSQASLELLAKRDPQTISELLTQVGSSLNFPL